MFIIQTSFLQILETTNRGLELSTPWFPDFLKKKKIKQNRENNIVTVVEFIIQCKLLSADK